MNIQIKRGKVSEPVKVVIYGPEGTGKSTLASLLPAPIVIDVEGSTGRLDVARITPSNAAEVAAAIKDVIANHSKEFKTLVVDTADWVESMLTDAMCAAQRKASIAECGGGYGKGYVELGRKFSEVLDLLDEAAGAGMHVVVLAHVKTVKVSPPDQIEGYTRYELKLNTEHVASRLKEWAHMVLFLRRDVQLIKGKDDRTKGGTESAQHLIQTAYTPAWDAKNRHDLPEALTYEKGILPVELARIFVASPSKAEAKTPKPAVVDVLAHAKKVEPVADQPVALTGYARLEELNCLPACAEVIKKAMAHYNCMEMSDFTDDQLAKVLARCEQVKGSA